jgi:hypothetical protein
MLQGLNFNEIVMHELGQIKNGILSIEEKLDLQNKQIENDKAAVDRRLKPLEEDHKRRYAIWGVLSGFWVGLLFIIEKVGVKWLS